LQQRTGDIADATADLLEAQLKTAEPLTEDELAIATTIQTDSPLEPQFRNFVNQ
jgi:hypothetical protein